MDYGGSWGSFFAQNNMRYMSRQQKLYIIPIQLLENTIVYGKDC